MTTPFSLPESYPSPPETKLLFPQCISGSPQVAPKVAQPLPGSYLDTHPHPEKPLPIISAALLTRVTSTLAPTLI